MIWQIIRREILSNLMSLRFALTALLVLTLMLLNGLVFVHSDYADRLTDYSRGVNEAMDRIREKTENLSGLAVEGPGNLFKRPSPLAFCAGGSDKSFPGVVVGESRGDFGWTSNEFQYSWKAPWMLRYPQRQYRKNPAMPAFTEIDWVLIVGLVMSFVAILFTFDAISGERERGTLRLVLSNPVPRDTVLLGKFVGALLSLLAPLLIGMLTSLLIISLSPNVSLGPSEWARIGTMVVLSVIYLSAFVGLGLLVSTRVARSSTSLVTLLVIWVIFVVLAPSTLGSISTNLRKVLTRREISRQIEAMKDNVDKQYDRDKLCSASPSDTPPKIEALRLWADYLNAKQDGEEKLEDKHLDDQFRQVALARTLTRISPAMIYQYALEVMSGTGFVRHRSFVQQARAYRHRFVEFIQSTDRSAADSYHVYLVKEGVSQKRVIFEEVPKFEEHTAFDEAFRQAMWDMGLLALFAILFFMAAYASFLRCDVG